MVLNEVSAVPVEALPVAALRSHLRLGTGFADDAAEDEALEGYLRSALAAIEARTGKALCQRQFSWTLSRWHMSDCQALPIAPVASLDRVVVTSADGVETEQDLSRFLLKADSHTPTIIPKSGSFPSLGWGSSIEIQFTAGYAEAFEDLPHDLQHATLVLAATYFDFRHGETTRGEVVPFGVMALLEPYRPVRIGRGAG